MTKHFVCNSFVTGLADSSTYGYHAYPNFPDRCQKKSIEPLVNDSSFKGLKGRFGSLPNLRLHLYKMCIVITLLLSFIYMSIHTKQQAKTFVSQIIIHEMN